MDRENHFRNPTKTKIVQVSKRGKIPKETIKIIVETHEGAEEDIEVATIVATATEVQGTTSEITEAGAVTGETVIEEEGTTEIGIIVITKTKTSPIITVQNFIAFNAGVRVT